MRYEIKGGNLPVVECHMENGESMITESGSMSWMSPNMKMETKLGGAKKIFGRMLSGENIFQNIFRAEGGEGMIAFASSFPGSIMACEIAPGSAMVVQKKAFLASEAGVELSIAFNKKIGAGFFGGEGFIMQKLSGQGTAFIEIDGSATEYNLQAGERLIVDTGYLAAMEETCSMDIVQVPGVKNMLFGGEGVFNTVVTGPGRVILQSMPIMNVAALLQPYINPKKN